MYTCYYDLLDLIFLSGILSKVEEKWLCSEIQLFMLSEICNLFTRTKIYSLQIARDKI